MNLHMATVPGRDRLARDLQEKIEDLEFEVRELRRQLGMQKDLDLETRFKMRWRTTGKEGGILSALYQAKGRTLSKDTLMSTLYDAGIDDQPEIKIVDVFVCKLRKKIGKDLIDTVWGQGYRMTPQGLATIAGLAEQELVGIRRAEAAPPPKAKPEALSHKLVRALIAHPGSSTRQLGGLIGVGEQVKLSDFLGQLRKRGMVATLTRVRNPQTRRWTNLWSATEAGIRYVEAFDAARALREAADGE